MESTKEGNAFFTDVDSTDDEPREILIEDDEPQVREIGSATERASAQRRRDLVADDHVDRQQLSEGVVKG